MEKWVGDTLSKCLDCVVTEQMMSTILAIRDDAEFDNYFDNLLNKENVEHRMFLHNCRHMLLSGKQPRSTQQTANKSTPKGGGGSSGSGAGGAAKKPAKYVNLYSKDGHVLGQNVLLKGRRSCDCQATEHKLINNCLGCGRIVCEQEASGPCLYCGQLVYTPEEELQMAKAATRGNKQQTGSSKKSNKSPGLQEALAQRDRLLEYDKHSEQRTTVIDDELDYFQENSVWLSEAEREKYEQLKSELQQLKHGSRVKRKIKVDFAGRELPDDESLVSKEYEAQLVRQLAAISRQAAASSASNSGSTTGLVGHSSLGLAPNLNVAKAPTYKPSKEQQQWPAAPTHDGLERVYNRVQDKELLELQDMRQCLSMHQPWASLLVAGIKKHEGRVWYSEHRGRLWIASTSKEPHADDIAQMEQFYRVLYNDDKLEFPKHYPTSSLLGCVHVDNCLPQEEYRDLYPQGESDSPYVFVCTNPEQLPMLLPVHGEHKIYELPLKTHNAACKTLLRARVNKG